MENCVGQAQAQSELELLYENSPAGLCFLDTELRYRRINRKLAEINGLPLEAHLGHTVQEVLPDVARVTDPILRKVIATHEPAEHLELHGKIPADPSSEKYWEGSFYPLIDEQGHVLGINAVIIEITEHKETEAALRESMERFRFLTEAMPHITFTADPDGKVNFYNQELGSYTGISTELLKGWDWARIVHPDDVEENLRLWRHALETGEQFAFEHRLRRADGVYRWFLCRAVPMRNGDMKIVMWIGTNTDIDDLKRGELALAHLAAIVDFSDDAIISKDLDTVITTWNRSAELLLGYTAKEMIGQSIFRIIPPEKQAREMGLFKEMVAGNLVGAYETERITKDGRRIDVSLTLSPIRNGMGKIIGASNIMHDIGERKKIEAELRDSEERFRSLADNMTSLTWMADANGNLFFYNRRFYEYTGTTLEEMQGWGWEKLHHPEHLPRVVKRWRESLQKGELWEDTFLLRGKDGNYRWFLARAFPIRGADGEITRWFGTNTDVTELRETQEALQAAQHELREHADKLERTVVERTAQLHTTISELQAFSYSLSHDMRAPLRAIRNFSHIVLDDQSHKLDPEYRNYLENVVRSSERLDRLITDVLALSRVSQDRIQIRPLKLQPLLEQVIQERPELQPPRVEIRIEAPMPAVLGHEASLVQCFTNLLANAVKFVAPGVQPKVRIWSERIGDEVRLWFEDNGIGIEPASQGRLFGMFQRLHPYHQYEGTGIGLAIVRKAIERMHGSAGVESEPGRGSRFWIQLPAAG